MESDFDATFQLRRIGMPATVPGIKDIFKLDQGITRIGRSPSNKVFLDSTALVNFISRWHSEIHCEIKHGKAKFIVKDQSVNGTYVNDIKIKERAMLMPGDRISFGHPFGRNLLYGQYAPQADSEFAFVFEKGDDIKIPESDPVSVEEYPIPLPVMQSPAHNTIHVKKDASYSDSPVIPVVGQVKQPSNSQDTPGSVSSSGSSVSRKIFDSPSGTVVLKDISNPCIKASPIKGLVHLDDLVYKDVLTPSKADYHRLPLSQSSTQEEDEIFKTAINAAKVFCVSDAESEEEVFSSSSFQVSQTSIQSTQPGFVALRPEPPQTSLASSPNATRSPPALLQHLLYTPATQPHLSQATTSSITSSSVSSQPTVPKGSIQKRRGRPPRRLGPVPVVTTTAVLEKPSQVPLPAPQAQKRKKPSKRKKSSAVTCHKKRRVPTHSSGTTEDDDEEDIVFHYDGEACDAYKCVQSISRQVSWVQCDDCDKWYHTDCAGCSYDDVKDENSQFHCGCI